MYLIRLIIMNKILFGGIAVVVLLGIVLMASRDGSPEALAEVASMVSVEQSHHDFGNIDIFGGDVITTYILKNDGTEDVQITSAVTSCMCTEGEIGDLVFGMHESSGTTVTIPAGGEQVLTATYDPLAHGPNGTGSVKRVLTLNTNSTATPRIDVTFSANVVKNTE